MQSRFWVMVGIAESPSSQHIPLSDAVHGSGSAACVLQLLQFVVMVFGCCC